MVASLANDAPKQHSERSTYVLTTIIYTLEQALDQADACGLLRLGAKLSEALDVARRSLETFEKGDKPELDKPAI